MLEPLIAYSQANPGRLKLSLFVDTPNGPSHPSLPSASLSVGRIGKEAVERATGSGQQSWWRRVLGTRAKGGSQEREGGKTVMFLVCGPDPYVSLDLSSPLAGLMVRLHSEWQDGRGHRRTSRTEFLTGGSWWGAWGVGVRERLGLEAVSGELLGSTQPGRSRALHSVALNTKSTALRPVLRNKEAKIGRGGRVRRRGKTDRRPARVLGMTPDRGGMRSK